MQVNKDSLYKRFKNAEGRRTNWRNTYKEALEYFSPQRDTFDHPTTGAKRTNTDRVFDSTGQDALQKAVSTVHSNIFPPQKKWGKLKLGPLLEKEGGADRKKKLEDITDLFFTCLHNSNFDTVVSEFLEDWLIGTGSMQMHKGTREKPFVFEPVPLNEVYLERGVGGTVGGRFRKWKLPNHLLMETWPDAKLPANIKAEVEANPFTEVTIIEYTIKDKIKTRVITQQGGKSSSKEQIIDGFRYVVQITNGGKGGDIIVNRETKSHPWITVRYAVSAGEVHGRGPVLSAHADNKTLNKTKELILKNGALAISGMWTAVDDGIINLENIVMEPGAIIPVAANPGNPNGPSISRLPSASDFNVAQIILDDLKKSIKSILFVDPLGEIDAPVKTATEIAMRSQSVAKMLGSAYGRMQGEGAEQIMLRGLYILEELGMVDLSGFTIDGSNIAIQHVSPLAVAQDQDELNAMTRYAETVSSFFGPQGLMMMTNPVAFGQELAKLLGVKEIILPTEEQLEALKQLMAQQLGGAPQGGQPPAQPQQ